MKTKEPSYSQKVLQKKLGKFPARLIGGVLAEMAMILGYFVFEGFLYGFAPSGVNIPANFDRWNKYAVYGN